MVGGIDAFYNNWQPKPPPRGSTAPPWPDASVFETTASNPLGDLRRRIDAYDQAAKQDSFTDTYVERTGIWGARIAAGEASEHFYPKAKPDWNNALHEKLNPFAAGSVPYEKILGIQKFAVGVGEGQYFQNYRDLLSKDGWNAYKYTLTENFKGFLRPSAMQPISPGEFCQHTLLSRNVEKITDELKNGRFMAALSRIAGPLLMGLGVVSKTKDVYRDAKAEGHTGLSLFEKVAKAFLGQSAKSILSWEAGSIGFAIGAAAFSIGTIPMLAAGILVGGVFSAACYKLLSKPIPDPLSRREILSNKHARR